VGVRLFHFAIAMPVLFMVLWSQGMRPGVSWLSLPLLAAVQYLIIVGIAYPLASINVVYRDTQHITMVLLQLMIYVTPVFYSLDLVPDSLRPWYCLNPMVGMIQSWRAVLMHNQWPDPGMLAVLGGLGLVLMVLGRRLFVAQSHRFVEEI
jgi:lipopolysaccharide transport system permease protein